METECKQKVYRFLLERMENTPTNTTVHRTKFPFVNVLEQALAKVEQVIWIHRQN